TGNARAEVLINIGYAFVIFLAKLVRFGVGIGIVFTPDDCDKLFTLFIGLQLLPGINLSSGKNRFHVPNPVRESVIWFAFDLSLFLLWIHWFCLLRKQLRDKNGYSDQDC